MGKAEPGIAARRAIYPLRLPILRPGSTPVCPCGRVAPRASHPSNLGVKCRMGKGEHAPSLEVLDARLPFAHAAAPSYRPA